MGLSHLLYLREYIKGSLFAALEVLFICLIPMFVRKIVQLVTLGDPHPELPLLKRDNSIFMLIDGILALSIIAIFVIAYILSVKSAEKSYNKYCALKRFSNQKNVFHACRNHAHYICSRSLGVLGCRSLYKLFGAQPHHSQQHR